MKKFIVLYHASEDAAKKMASATPEEMKAGMEPWMAWAKKCGSALVDFGTPLRQRAKSYKDRNSPEQQRGHRLFYLASQ